MNTVPRHHRTPKAHRRPGATGDYGPVDRGGQPDRAHGPAAPGPPPARPQPRDVLAVLYLDLDRFKVINDSLGHRIGDDVLLKIAERLTHHLRPADTLARLGGDEFVLVAEGVTDEAAAITLANRIIEDGRKPFHLDGDEFSCTMSIGVACTADSQRNGEELLSEADLALYRAKDKGRDRVAVVRRGTTHHGRRTHGHRTDGAAGP